MSCHDIDTVGEAALHPPWDRISTCTILVLKNDKNCKYIFMFSQNNLAYRRVTLYYSIPFVQLPSDGDGHCWQLFVDLLPVPGTASQWPPDRLWTGEDNMLDSRSVVIFCEISAVILNDVIWSVKMYKKSVIAKGNLINRWLSANLQ